MKTIKLILVVFTVLVIVIGSKDALAQGVAINEDGSDADASAMLDVKSTSAGMLIPRMTESDRNNITSPATGLLIYQTNNDPGYYYYDGGSWVRLSVGDEVDPTWDGDANTTSDVGRSGKVGIGTTSPVGKLHVEHSGTIGTTAYTMENAWLRVGALGFDPNEITTDGDLYITGQNFIRLGSGSNNSIMQIDPSNRVGIGTTSPATQLHTTGTVRFANYPSGANGAIVRTDGNGNLETTDFTGNASDILLGDNSFGSVTDAGAVISSCGNANYVPKMISSTELDCSQIFDDGTNVGIGTESPDYPLHTVGDIYASSSLRTPNNFFGKSISPVGESDILILLTRWEGGYNEIIGEIYGQRSSGAYGVRKVNIRYSSASSGTNYNAYLDYDAGTYGSEQWSLVRADYNGNSYLAARYQGSPYWHTHLFFSGYVRTDGNESELFQSIATADATNIAEINYASRKHIKSNLHVDGKVGIGTTSPASTLHVDGSVRFSNLGTGSETTSLMIDGNGDVSARTLNISNWDAAYNWGDHATEGYLTNFDEVDPTWDGDANTTSDVGRTGNVGIGTTNPGYELDVLGSDLAVARFRRTTTGGTSGGIQFGNSDQVYEVFGNTTRAALRANGSYIMYWGANGNVGIGTTSPEDKLHVSGGHVTVDDGNRYAFIHQNSHWAMGRNIHNDAPGSGGDDIMLQGYGSSGNSFQVISQHGTSDSFSYNTRFQVNFDNGNVGIGTTSPNSKLHIETTDTYDGLRLDRGSSYRDWEINTATTENLWFMFDGNLTAWITHNDGAWNTSDRRLKNNIEPIDNVLEKIVHLEPVTFYYNRDKERNRKSIGLIAQEVKEHFPLAAQIEEEFGYYGINYDYISVLTLEGLIELNDKHEKTSGKLKKLIEQQQQIKQLRQKNSALEKRINELEEIVGKIIESNKE